MANPSDGINKFTHDNRPSWMGNPTQFPQHIGTDNISPPSNYIDPNILTQLLLKPLLGQILNTPTVPEPVISSTVGNQRFYPGLGSSEGSVPIGEMLLMNMHKNNQGNDTLQNLASNPNQIGQFLSEYNAPSQQNGLTGQDLINALLKYKDRTNQNLNSTNQNFLPLAAAQVIKNAHLQQGSPVPPEIMRNLLSNLIMEYGKMMGVQPQQTSQQPAQQRVNNQNQQTPAGYEDPLTRQDAQPYHKYEDNYRG